MSSALALGLSALLLLGNAFFVAAEFALVAARRSEIETRSESWLAQKTLAAMENVSLYMATAQLGITLCTLGLGALAEPALAHALEDVLGPLGQGIALPLSVGIALFIVAALHVVLGEMVPKNAALALPSRTALLLSLPLRFCAVVLFPFVWALNEAANLVLRMLRVEPRQEVASAFTRDEVAGLVEESRREGKLDQHESTLVASALRFEERTVRAVSLPVSSWVSLATDAAPSDLEQLVVRHGYSRFPICENGEVLGYLHAKDALEAESADEPFPRSVWRSLPQISPDDSLRSALESMQHYDTHLARVVVDEKIVGIVALEDVLEELVGEVRDVAGRIVRAT